ncbi:MAG: hypothetical protein ACWGN1_03235 [Desulfobulbales bacterium]
MFVKRNSLIYILLLLLALSTTLFLTFAVFLPSYIGKRILPDLGDRLAVSLAGRVSRIGPYGADLGDVVLGPPENSAAVIAAIHADYSVASLLAGKLDRVTINGLVLHLEVNDGRITIPGLDLKQIAGNKGERDIASQQSGINLPFELDSLQIKNSLVAITFDTGRFLLPFELQLYRKSPGDSNSAYDFNLQMMPEAGKVLLTGTIDLRSNRAILSLNADAVALHRLPFWAAVGKNMLDIGMVSVKGGATLNLQPLQIEAANINFTPEKVSLGNTAIGFGRSGSGTEAPFLIDLQQKNDQMMVSLQGSVQSPLAVSVALNGSVTTAKGTVQGQGTIAVSMIKSASGKNDSAPLITVQAASDLRTDFSLLVDKSGAWKVDLRDAIKKHPAGAGLQLHALNDKVHVETEMPSLHIRGQGTPETGEIQATLVFPQILVDYAGIGITASSASLHTSYTHQVNKTGTTHGGATFNLAIMDTEFRKNGLHGRGNISLQGNFLPEEISGETVLQAKGGLSVTDAAIDEDSTGIAVGSIVGKIPWSWPQSQDRLTGTVKASRIVWRNADLGAFGADISLHQGQYLLDGRFDSNLLKGVVAHVSGQAYATTADIHGELGVHVPVTPFGGIDLGRFAPALSQTEISGELGLESTFIFAPRTVKGSMQLALQNGTLASREKKYRISGINLDMRIPALPDLRTEPAQTFNFSTATMGNLTFSNGKVTWQIESGPELFLEEGVVQWVGGRIFTNGVRLSQKTKEIVVPIFCDHLKLTEMLQQFGINDAEGDGTVNGRIPLRLGKNNIAIAEGFLYSSPGQGGSIKVAAMDLLSAGIPKNSPQFAQVDFAAAALKDFRYNWVKLVLDSAGEDFIMQMQLDGRPGQSLPFTYDSATGALKRVENGTQGINQAIRLDVNFRLPMNRFLGYSGKIQDLIKKIK